MGAAESRANSNIEELGHEVAQTHAAEPDQQITDTLHKINEKFTEALKLEKKRNRQIRRKMEARQIQLESQVEEMMGKMLDQESQIQRQQSQIEELEGRNQDLEARMNIQQAQSQISSKLEMLTSKLSEYATEDTDAADMWSRLITNVMNQRKHSRVYRVAEEALSKNRKDRKNEGGAHDATLIASSKEDQKALVQVMVKQMLQIRAAKRWKRATTGNME